MGSPASLNSLLSSVTASSRRQTETCHQVETDLRERSRTTPGGRRGHEEAAPMMAEHLGNASAVPTSMGRKAKRESAKAPQEPTGTLQQSLGGHISGSSLQARDTHACSCVDESLSSPDADFQKDLPLVLVCV